jgi:hypothetical protein
MPRPGLLEVLAGPNQGRTFFLPLNETVSIGSALESWATLPHDPRLSDYHCSICCDGEYFHLCDLNSQYGTFVYGINIASIGAVPLPVGESFTAGDSTFQVRWWPPEVIQTLRKQSEPLLALIDASRDVEILPLLSRSEVYYDSLFEGTWAQWLITWAPYLVQLPKSSRLLESLVREGWGKHWGVYLTSLAPFEVVRAHMRRWLWIQTEEGKKLYFRFYDPRTLRAFLPTLSVREQQQFFGPVKRWLLEDGCEGEVLEYVPEPGVILERSLVMSSPFIIRPAQIRCFEKASYVQFKEQIHAFLSEQLPQQSKALGVSGLHDFIEAGIAAARRYGLEAEQHLVDFLWVRLKWGANFDHQYDWAVRILNATNLTPANKIAQLKFLAQ